MGILSIFKNNNSKTSFKETYETYYSRIYKNICYLTGDAHTAEDLTQEVFIKLFNEPPGHSNIAAWLNKVATNLAYNHLRNQKIRNNKGEILQREEQDDILLVEDEVIKSYELALAKRVLNMLPPRDRMCLLLKFSGYKYSEISEIVNIDKHSVGTILSRAQAKFKEMYLKEDKRGEANEMST